MKTAANQEARFWARIDRSGGAGACWPWLGPVHPYGQFWWRFSDGSRLEKTHRIAFFIANGHLPRGRCRGDLIVLHSCDHPPCCNPAHLSLGSHRDNVQDCIERGRSFPTPRFTGSNHPRAKLTEKTVRAARDLARVGVGCSDLARRFDVGETTMGHALAGRTWRHV